MTDVGISHNPLRLILRAEDIRLSCQPGLYRHFHKRGALLYVGQTINCLSRSAGHLNEAAWRDDICTIDLEPMSKEEAVSREMDAIRNERPLWNKKISQPAPPLGCKLLCYELAGTRWWGLQENGKPLLPLFRSREDAIEAWLNARRRVAS